ncbi:hypothetical protein [Streptomyces sp. NPDC059452]|uniref:hypothetical protein n=1 Tax=Streptomyces sp. NPDC059452 TaxID=3346835 RepID=UPI0036B1BA84
MPDTTHDPRAWVAPLTTTLVTVPAGLVALLVGGFTPMVCDSCVGPAGDRFEASFGPAWTILWVGLTLALITLIASWAAPWQLRNASLRLTLALAAPATVVVTFVAFMSLVDWP